MRDITGIQSDSFQLLIGENYTGVLLCFLISDPFFMSSNKVSYNDTQNRGCTLKPSSKPLAQMQVQLNLVTEFQEMDNNDRYWGPCQEKALGRLPTEFPFRALLRQGPVPNEQTEGKDQWKPTTYHKSQIKRDQFANQRIWHMLLTNHCTLSRMSRRRWFAGPSASTLCSSDSASRNSCLSLLSWSSARSPSLLDSSDTCLNIASTSCKTASSLSSSARAYLLFQASPLLYLWSKHFYTLLCWQSLNIGPTNKPLFPQKVSFSAQISLCTHHTTSSREQTHEWEHSNAMS